MLFRSPVTVIPVLDGPEAGETTTVRSVLPPGSREFGLADPEPERLPLPAHVFVIELLRGIGPPVTLKSALLLSVSVQPLLFLIAATGSRSRARVTFRTVGSAVRYEIHDTVCQKAGQLPLKTVVATSATFAVEPTAIAPVVSGVGRRTVVVVLAPAAS